jgi:uncharacterized damage-inducible protein DinB
VDTTLVELFRHNQWANLRLLAACSGLSEEQLDASAAGTYGHIADTLVHILAAEERYVTQLTGNAPERPLRESAGFPGFGELEARAQASGDALIKIAERDPFAEVLHGSYQEEPYSIRAVVPLVQAIHHATKHRTQVLTILSQQGIEPPDLSGWAFGDAMGY